MALNNGQLLQKHMTSLRNAAARGRKPAGCVAQVAKYEALRESVAHEDAQLWNRFCTANRLPKDHTAYHLFNV